MIHSTIIQTAKPRTSGLLSLAPLSLFPANFPTAPTAKRLSKLLLLGLSLAWLWGCPETTQPNNNNGTTNGTTNGGNPTNGGEVYTVTNITYNVIVFTNSTVRHFSNFANVYFGTNTYATVTYTTNAEAFSLLFLSNDFTVTNINVLYQTIIRNITNEIEPDIDVVTSSNRLGTNTTNRIFLMGGITEVVDSTNDRSMTNLIASNLITTTNFSGFNFSDRDLSYLDLAGFNLSDADLRNANLSRTCLLSANITGADFTGANTNGTIFTFIQNITNVTDGGSLKLDNPRGVTTAKVGDTTYLFVAGRNDDEVSVFSVGDDGGLSNVTNVSDDSSLKLEGAISVTTAEVGSTTYLFVAGNNDNGFSVFSVGDDGGLSNVTNVSDGGSLEVEDAISVTTAEVGSTTYLFVAGFDDNGFSVFSVGDDGGLSNVTNVSDDSSLQLNGAWDVTTAEVGVATYLFVSGNNDNGFSVFSVGDDGGLSNVTNITSSQHLGLNALRYVTTSEVGGTTYLFVAGLSFNTLLVFSVAADGGLSHVGNVQDGGSLEIDGSTGVTTAEVGDTTYLFVTGREDNGVSVFSVADNGDLNNVANVSDDSSLQLDGAWYVTTAKVGGATYLFVTGVDDDGVSVFSVGCGE